MSRAKLRKRTVLLPAVDWRMTVLQPQALSRAGRFISRRYGLQPHIAETVAVLAGLGDKEGQYE